MDIKSFHPADESAAACRDALDRIRAATADTEAKITEASGRRDRLMTEGSVREIRQAEQAVADARLDLDRLRLLAERVGEQLDEAEARALREAAEREHAAVTEAIAAHLAKTEKELPKLVAPLRALLRERRALIDRVNEANQAGAGIGLPWLDAGRLNELLIETRLPETEAEKAAEAARREEEVRTVRSIREESLRRRQREIDEHAAAESAREGAPKLDRAGAVDMTPNGPVVRLVGGARS